MNPLHSISSLRFSINTIRKSRSFVRLLALLALVSIAAITLAATSSSANVFGPIFTRAAAVFGSKASAPETKAVAERRFSPALNSAGSAEPLSPVSAIATERRGHTATRLSDGRVLIAGGESSNGVLNQTEIYDATTDTFSAGSNMNDARVDHTATLLSDGRVLIAGGSNSAGALSTTEIFDPTTGTFSSGPNMSVTRAGHSATLFTDGQILFAGGDAGGSAEILNATLNNSTPTDSLSSARSMHSAALLLDGRVLIVGGRDADGNALSTAEIFDVAGSSFSIVGSQLTVARVQPHLRVLFDGKVQIIGGSNDGSMEIYDPSIETIGAYAHVLPESDTCAGLPDQILASQTRAALFHNGQADPLFDRSGHTITELNGHALVVGGANTSGAILSSTSVVASSSASITTDKLDYAPGETATITGRGFQPGEVVRLKIHEDPHTPQERGFDATADASGNFSGEYLVQDYDLNMKFIVGARGLTSGQTAQTTFTDAKGLNVTFAGTGSGTVNVVVNAPNASDSFNCTGTPNPCSNNIDNNATGTITATPNAGSVFSGWTGTFVSGGTTTCTGTTSPCTFSMSNAAQSLIATFTANPATVTPATGGAAISADTAGGSYTSLTGPVLAENGTAQIGMGTLILNAPSGFVFDIGGIVPSVLVGCLTSPCTTIGNNINNVATGTSVAITSRTATTITFTVTAPTANSIRNSLTWQNIRVRPTAGAPLATGNITLTGTSTITNGVSSTNFGTLTEVPGAPNKLVFGQQPSTTDKDATISPAITVQIRDASNNLVSSTRSITLAIGTNPSSGTLSGTTTIAAVGGTATFNNLSINNAGNGYTLIASSPTPAPPLTTATSNTFNINKLNQTITFGALANKTYGDATFGLTATASSALDVSFSSTTPLICTTTGTNGATVTILAAGTCSVTASQAGNSNYNSATDVVQTFTVNKASLTVTANDASRGYGDANPTFTATLSGFKNSETLATSGVTGSASCSSLATATSPASPPTVAITCTAGTLAANNYDFPTLVAGALTITKAHLTVTANDASREYGDANPTFTATLSGFKNSETLATSGVTGLASCSSTATATSPASPPTVAITCTGGTLAANNYDFPTFAAGALTITKAHLTVTANDASREYGDANPTFTATLSGFKNLETLATSGVTGSASCSSTATATSPASPPTVAITCTGGTLAANNYDFPTLVAGALTITKAHLTVTANDASREYGDANPTFTATLSGFKNLETLATSGVTGSASCSSTATATSPASPPTVAITCTVGTLAANNYDFPTFVAGALTITKAHLTVTGDNASREYGDANPTFTATISGYKNGETLGISGVSGTASCSSTATATTPASPPTYPIVCTQGTLAANNYDFPAGNFLNGALTITKAHLTITADNASREYGDANPTFTATISGFKNSETQGTSGITGTASCTTTALATSPASPPTFSITCTQGTLVANNYDFPVGNFVAGELTITKAHLTVTGDNASRDYGDANPSFTATISGFKNSETLATSGVSGTASCTTTAVATSPASPPTFPISCIQGTLTASNYDFPAGNFVNGALTINKRLATWNTDPASKTYGDADPNPLTTGSGSNFVAADNVTANYSRAAGENASPPTYHITATLSATGDLNNYIITNTGAEFTINKRLATWTTNPNSKTYGDPEPVPLTTGSGSNFVAADGVTATYSRVAGENASPPTYHITATLSATGDLNNYIITNTGAEFTINKRLATWTTNPNSKTYGDPEPVPLTTGSGSNFVAADGVTATYSRVAGENASPPTYHITATLSATGNLNNYIITNDGAEFTINKRLATWTTNPNSKTYGDLEPVPLTTGSGSNFVTTDGVTATYSRVAGENASPPTYHITATLSATGDLNNYIITNAGNEFTINKAATVTTVTCPLSETYTGSAIEPCTFTVTGANLNLGPTPLASSDYSNNVIVGTATSSYTYVPDANHTGSSDSKTFAITPATTTTVVTCPASETYTGSAIMPCTFTVTGANLNLGPTALAAGDYSNNVIVGTAAASYTYVPDANHTGSSDSKTFAITPATTTTVVTCPASETYTGSAIMPCTFTVTGANLNLGPTALAAGDYSNNVNVGTATASYTYVPDANHTGSSDSKTFAITPATTTTVVTCPTSETYTGSAIEPCTFTVTGANLNLGPTALASSDYSNNVTVGTATASHTYVPDANHTGSSDSKTFAITQAASSTVIECSPGSFIFTGGLLTPCTVTVTGVGGLNTTTSITYANNTGVGTATANASYSGDANHSNSTADQVTFAITQATSSTTVTCGAGPFTYNGMAQTPCSVSIIGAGGLNLTPTPNYSNNTNAGTATASYTYAGDANHSGSSDSKNFMIAKRNTLTTVSSTLNPSTFGQSVSFSAMVAGTGAGAGNPGGGSVQFKIDGSNFGVAVALSGSGASSGATAVLAAGNHTVEAVFTSSDANFSNSSDLLDTGQLVNKRNTLTTVSSSVNPSTFGQSVTFTATVVGTGVGTGNPGGGSVQFKVDGSNFGVAVALSGGSASSGATTTLAAGNHTVEAIFTSSDSNFNGSSDLLDGGQTILGARGIKQSVLAELQALRAASTNKHDKEKLDVAILRLQTSLNPQYWIDDNHVKKQYGKKVFNYEKEAVSKLRDLIKHYDSEESGGCHDGHQGDNDDSDRDDDRDDDRDERDHRASSIPEAVVRDFINRIVSADRILAQVAINDAITGGGTAQDIAKAQADLADGDHDVLKKKYQGAIQDYRDAWKRVTH